MSGLVLGLDPSLTAYGWAVVALEERPRVIAAGCIRAKLAKRRTKSAPKTAGSAARLAAIARGVLDVLDAQKPDRVVSECPTGGRNAGTAKALGQSFALTVTCCEVAGRPAAFVTPRAVKLAATGDAEAEKADVARCVEAITGWRSSASTAPAREAEADAVAVALAGTTPAADGYSGVRVSTTS